MHFGSFRTIMDVTFNLRVHAGASGARADDDQIGSALATLTVADIAGVVVVGGSGLGRWKLFQ